MKTKHWPFLLGAIILLGACKKNEYSNTSTSTQPVFSFSGNINNGPINIQAGVNNYYMNTSYSKDSNGVYDYTGEFMNITCSSNCPNSLKIYFKDYRQSSLGPPTYIDSLITPGYYNYAASAGQPTGYYVPFHSYSNQVSTGCQWNFGDGQSSTNANPVHYYYHPGIYTVALTVNSSGCSSSDTNNIIVGQTGNAFLAPFSYSAFVGFQTQFSASVNGIPPFTYAWSFGDDSISSVPSPTHRYPGAGVYHVSLTITDATGYRATYHSNVPTPEATGCADGFYESAITPGTNPYNLNDVGIEWYDSGGNLWKSENKKQGSTALFKVTSVADYKNNTAGQPTKIINATVSCELYNGTDSIPLKGNVVFGIAHL